MHDFQDTGFVPFDYWVERARQQRLEREKNAEHQRRVTDFLDGVTVTELTDTPPEFADGVTVTELTDASQHEIEKALRAKLQRAAAAMSACQHLNAKLAGHYPPGSHEV